MTPLVIPKAAAQATLTAGPGIPGVIEELLTPLKTAELARRHEILMSRTPALPPPERQTYARHFELPSPPRVAGRPRDRNGQVNWWGSGLPN